MWGYYDPWFDYSNDQSGYLSNENANYNAMDAQQARLEQRLDHIEDRIDGLVNRLQNPAAPASSQVPAAATANAAESATFVFRDGHSEQVQNYAIVGQTLWIFTEQRARKVPLAEINSEETEKTNAQHGIDLHLPKG